MEDTRIQDKLMFYILSKLKRFGHEKLPLEIIKQKQSYIVWYQRKRWNCDELNMLKCVFSSRGLQGELALDK